MTILDHIAAAYRTFRPKTAADYFALSLAKHLGDSRAAVHYAMLAAQHSQDVLRAAYGRAIRCGDRVSDLGRRFHAELGRGRPDRIATATVLAIKVERRCLGAAVLVGDRLDYVQFRQLSSELERAVASTIGFLNWLIANYAVDFAALETLLAESEIRRAELTRAALTTLARAALPIRQVSKADLLESFGEPPLRSRKELRTIVLSIFPVLGAERAGGQVLDAAGLGLYVQTERLFHINDLTS